MASLDDLDFFEEEVGVVEEEEEEEVDGRTEAPVENVVDVLRFPSTVAGEKVGGAGVAEANVAEVVSTEAFDADTGAKAALRIAPRL